MIVYSATKEIFSDDILSNQIVEKILSCLKRNIGHSVGESEIRAFRNSLRYMDKVLQDPAIPGDSGISIEYQIPQTGKRIDFIVSGKDDNARFVAVLIELKQWEQAELTKKDGIVSTFLGGGMRERPHPSYQAWSYAALLEDFNESVRADNIILKPCAYLHNYERDDVITNRFYEEYLKKAPVFLKSDALKLREFLKKHVKHGDAGEVMYRIDHGRIRPSKSLADKLSSLLQGNQEFIMIDDQKVVYETALALADKASNSSKQVLIVEGGPGTGKSVVAVNLLVALINKQLNAQYVTKNAAPRAVYESKLAGTLRKTRITNLFSGSGAYTECAPNVFDVLIVDEAHRLNAKSGMFQNKGENQIKEIIRSSKVSVFFIDEDQRVTLKDIGRKEEIEQWARRLDADIKCVGLSSQFRCNGSDGYLAWLDNTLQIRETTNTILDVSNYDFKIANSPNELRDLIFEKNKINNKARIVAGYCWDWKSKSNPNINDIEIPEHGFSMRWNLASDGNLWILNPDSVNEAGCIHTCQGLELDYVGVIVGPDLACRDEMIMTDCTKRAKTDASVKGYKKFKKEHPEQALAKMDAIIKNTYKTLMTRAMKGCYVYFVDKDVERFFKSRIGRSVPGSVSSQGDKKSPIQIIPIENAKPYLTHLPVYSLKAAAGYFGNGEEVREDGWARVSGLKLDKDMFIAQVVGCSMEPKIPNGSYCVFRARPAGSRQGKIVLAQHRDIADPETMGAFTVKRYKSEKINNSDGTWQHRKIALEPLNADYKPIEILEKEAGSVTVIAEFVAALNP